MLDLLLVVLGCFAPLWFEIVLLGVRMRAGKTLHLSAMLLCCAYFVLLIALGYVSTSRFAGIFWLDLANYAVPWSVQLLFLSWYLRPTHALPKPSLRPWQLSIKEILVVMTLIGIALALPRAFGYLVCGGGLFLLLVFLRQHGLQVLGWGGALILLAAVVISVGLRMKWIVAPFTPLWIVLYWSTLGTLLYILDRLAKRSRANESVDRTAKEQPA